MLTTMIYFRCDFGTRMCVCLRESFCVFLYQLTGNHFCLAPKIWRVSIFESNAVARYGTLFASGVHGYHHIEHTHSAEIDWIWTVNSEHIHPYRLCNTLVLEILIQFFCVLFPFVNPPFKSKQSLTFSTFSSFLSDEMPQCCAHTLFLSIVRLYKSNTRLVFMALRVF